MRTYKELLDYLLSDFYSYDDKHKTLTDMVGSERDTGHAMGVRTAQSVMETLKRNCDLYQAESKTAQAEIEKLKGELTESTELSAEYHALWGDSLSDADKYHLYWHEAKQERDTLRIRVEQLLAILQAAQFWIGKSPTDKANQAQFDNVQVMMRRALDLYSESPASEPIIAEMSLEQAVEILNEHKHNGAKWVICASTVLDKKQGYIAGPLIAYGKNYLAAPSGLSAFEAIGIAREYQCKAMEVTK